MYTASEYPREGSKRWGVFCAWSRTWVLLGRKSVMKKRAKELNDGNTTHGVHETLK